MQEESKISQTVEPSQNVYPSFTVKQSAIVGIHLHERLRPQTLYFHFIVNGLDPQMTNAETQLLLKDCIASVTDQQKPLLIERLAFNIAREAFSRLPHLSFLELKVVKPSAMNNARAPYAGVRMRR